MIPGRPTFGVTKRLQKWPRYFAHKDLQRGAETDASSIEVRDTAYRTQAATKRTVHKSCGDMSQCTSIGSADASISRRVECKGICNQGNFLESATRTQKTASFSLVQLDLSIFQWRLPKKELKFFSRQIRNLGKKQRRAAASSRSF